MTKSKLKSEIIPEMIRNTAYLKRHFIYFAWIASINHALTYVVTAYASSILDHSLSSIILGLSWSLNAVSGLTIATPVVKMLGWKYAMIISLAGYTIQLCSVFISLQWPDSAWPVAIIGSSISGITSAIWWTSQGVCYERTVNSIVLNMATVEATDDAEENDVQVNNVSADLAAYWTVIYQVSDIIVFISLSIFPMFLHISFKGMLAALCVIGVITTILGFTFDTLGERKTEYSAAELKKSILAVPHQFANDARSTLLAPFVFGFGITTAMFAYYVNDDVITMNLGQEYIGFLEGYSYFIATLSAFPYAYVSVKFEGGRHYVMQFGSLMFLLSGVLVFCLSNSQLSSWSIIFIVRGLYGLGRGVFEGACRAVYASLFKGDQLAAAFSGQTLLAGISGGTCFFLYGVLDKPTIAAITIVNGVVAIVCYYILWFHPQHLNRIPWKNICSSKQSSYSSMIDAPLVSHYSDTDDVFVFNNKNNKSNSYGSPVHSPREKSLEATTNFDCNLARRLSSTGASGRADSVLSEMKRTNSWAVVNPSI